MALSDDGRLPALAADQRPGRHLRGHGDGNQGPGAGPIRAIRQDGRALVHQALGRTGHRRITPNADSEANALNRPIWQCVGRP